MAEPLSMTHVRTPRGRGKKDGSLHEVPALKLARQTLEAIRDRNGLDTALVDDIIFGCVDPVGEAGGVIPRAAAFEAGYDTNGAGHADQPLLRVRPRCHQFRARPRSCPGQHEIVDRRRRRIDVPRRHRRVRRRLAHGSVGRAPGLFHAAGRLRRPDRHQIRLLARRRRRLCGREPEARGRSLGGGPLQEFGHPGEGLRTASPSSTSDEHMRPDDRHAVARRAQAVLRADGRDGRLRRRRRSRRIRRSRRSTMSTMPAIRPASSTARPPCCSARRRPARRWA